MSSIVLKPWFVRAGQTYRVAGWTNNIHGYAVCEYVGKRANTGPGVWTRPVQSRWKIVRQMTDAKRMMQPGRVEWMLARKNNNVKAVPAWKAQRAIEQHDRETVEGDCA